MTLKKSRLIFYSSFIFLIIFLKFIISFSTGLFEDEAIYWKWSQSIDPSYSLTTISAIAFFTKLFNSNSEFIIRLPALLINFIIVYVIFKTGVILNSGNDNIIITALTFLSIPFVTVYTSFISPDSFLLLFGIISVYYLILSVMYQERIYYILSGLFTGLMILSKYTAVVYLIAVLAGLFLINKKFTKNTMLLLLTAFLTSSPLLIWNLINEPVWLKYYILTDADKLNLDPFDLFLSFLISQLSILMPFALLLIIILFYKIVRWNFVLPELRFLKYLSIILIVFFSIFSLTGKIKGNWFFMMYIPLMFLLLKIRRDNFTKIVISLTVIFNLLLLIFLNLPGDTLTRMSEGKILSAVNYTYSYYWPDYRKNANNDESWTDRIIKMKRWENAIGTLETKINNLEAKYDFIICDDFNLCPLLEYYFENKKQVSLLGDLRFRYINSSEYKKELYGKDALLISVNDSENLIKTNFINSELIEYIDIDLPGNRSKQFKIFMCREFSPETNVLTN